MLKPNQLYHCNLLPGHWVATDADGQPWQYPVIPRGWERRKRYRGHIAALVEAANINAVGTGWLPARRKGEDNG